MPKIESFDARQRLSASRGKPQLQATRSGFADVAAGLEQVAEDYEKIIKDREEGQAPSAEEGSPRFLPGPPKDRGESAVALREQRRKARLLAAQAAAEASDNMAKAQAEAERGAPGFTEARHSRRNVWQNNK